MYGFDDISRGSFRKVVKKGKKLTVDQVREVATQVLFPHLTQCPKGGGGQDSGKRSKFPNSPNLSQNEVLHK